MVEKKLIQIVGKGCKKCEKQYEIAIKAVEESGKTDEYNVEHFTDITKFADLDVMLTPALRIDGKVVAEGRVIGVEKIKNLL
ncbi:MAG: thioredoxin family protein [Candidatus Heimdallarchaeota archaeon]|nr:thioredoxin family protein [Candidatus Heimdallarchaeota archaeon]MCK4878023.1 thioredoxin family protein [Candidatus Heimdallarchaeota archaeon]